LVSVQTSLKGTRVPALFTILHRYVINWGPWSPDPHSTQFDLSSPLLAATILLPLAPELYFPKEDWGAEGLLKARGIFNVGIRFLWLYLVLIPKPLSVALVTRATHFLPKRRTPPVSRDHCVPPTISFKATRTPVELQSPQVASRNARTDPEEVKRHSLLTNTEPGSLYAQLFLSKRSAMKTAFYWASSDLRIHELLIGNRVPPVTLQAIGRRK
jgi:hypothetical protein